MYKPDSDMLDKLKEECGIFGIYNRGNLNVSLLTYYGLYALQHRGQESCGIVVHEGKNGHATIAHKGKGLVSENFNQETISKLQGNISVGHVRYSTTGSNDVSNIQPLILRYINGTLSVAHNGNLINANYLRQELEKGGAVFQTTADTEVIGYYLARELVHSSSIIDAVEKTMSYIKGSYSLLIMLPGKLIAVRDPLGIRPLCMGKIGNSTVFASESCAFDASGAEFIRDIQPGEVVCADKEGVTSNFRTDAPKPRICVFEYIYFARPDSIIEKRSVYRARLAMGARLAKLFPVEADLVSGVPDSGITAAIGYSDYSGIKYGESLLKNRYVGRTFIKPDQMERDMSVSIKLNAIRSMVNGKRIVIIDDSVVRGTTVTKIVKALRKAGAKEIHMRVSSPPVAFPCYYGIDTPSADKLIASRCSVEEIRKFIGVDTLGYLSLEDVMDSLKGADTEVCSACFNGKYLIDHAKKMDIKYQFEGADQVEYI